MKKINTEKPILDSLQIWLPIDNEVEIVNYKLGAEYYRVYKETGETDEINEHIEQEVKRVNNTITSIKDNGIISVTKTTETYGKNVTRPVLKITISAKVLKEQYFNGLLGMGEIIYKEIMNLNIVKCSYEKFMRASPKDMDFAKNKYIEQNENFDKITRLLVNLCKKNERKINVFRQELNKGIEFNIRGKDTATKPYVKLYHKGIELKTKTKEFKNTYLKKYDTENLIRLEATIKNNTYRKILQNKEVLPKFETLGELLKIDGGEFDKFICYAINQYRDNTIQMKTTNKDKQPRNTIIEWLLKELITAEVYSSIEIMELSINEINHKDENKQKTYRKRTKKWLQERVDKIAIEDEEFKIKIKNEKDLKETLKWIEFKM